jgi:hypothetical protein
MAKEEAPGDLLAISYVHTSNCELISVFDLNIIL